MKLLWKIFVGIFAVIGALTVSLKDSSRSGILYTL